MSRLYLTWLADELRAAGLAVIESDGWQTRARSSGGYADPLGPLCVMWHHTASDNPAADQVRYQLTAPTAPIANISIDTGGRIWLMAAGATNTNGAGGPQTFSRGTVPRDRMNEHAFGIEIMNNGIGGPYPRQQIDAAFTVSNVVNRRCHNQPDDVCTHSIWSPGRKIDPARAAAVQGPWRPRGFNGTADSWLLDDLRAECLRRATPQPPNPPTPPGDDHMFTYLFRLADGSVGIRTPTGCRRVSAGELTIGPLAGQSIWPVPAGSADEARITAELRTYDTVNP